MGKKYDLTVWGDQSIRCAICHKMKSHGVGVEGAKAEFDVCDDCAGHQIVLGVKANDRARAHIEQGKKLHAKIEALRREEVQKGGTFLTDWEPVIKRTSRFESRKAGGKR